MEAADRANALLRSPLGSFFVLAVAEGHVPLEKAVAPPIAWAIACEGVEELTPWSGDQPRSAEEALSRAKEHRDVAHRIVEQPEASWWFDPLDRSAQVWLGHEGDPTVDTPTSPPTSWERYAQKPRAGLFTSTNYNEVSHLRIAWELQTGDYSWLGSLRRTTFEMSPEARVFEIEGPHDWHALCRENLVTDDRPDSPFPGGLVPDWGSVARSWDAVHLSFDGLLTAFQVREGSEAGWSLLWAWDNEQTLWLRDAATDRRPLPDLTEQGDWYVDMGRILPRPARAQSMTRPVRTGVLPRLRALFGRR